MVSGIFSVFIGNTVNAQIRKIPTVEKKPVQQYLRLLSLSAIF